MRGKSGQQTCYDTDSVSVTRLCGEILGRKHAQLVEHWAQARTWPYRLTRIAIGLGLVRPGSSMPKGWHRNMKRTKGRRPNTA